MGMDLESKSLLGCEDVFADISNVNLFDGTPIVTSEQLDKLPTELIYKNNYDAQNVHYLDTRMKVANKKADIVILCTENQLGVDNTMPVRDMGYQYSNYNEQIKEIKRKNEEQGRHYPIEKIDSEQKIVPVVSLVLYYGKGAWSGPACLMDMFDIPEEEKTIWEPLIDNHKIRVINLREQDEKTRAKYQSDFRHVVDYLATEGDIEKQRQFLKDENKKVKHPEEYLDMMATVTKEKHFTIVKETVMKNQEKEIESGEKSMASIFEILKIEKQEGHEEGKREGRREGKREIIYNMLKNKQEPEFIHSVTNQPLDVIYQIKEEMAFVHEGEEYGKK